MALNNVRRDSWFKCKINDKVSPYLARGWNKSIRKQKARIKAEAEARKADECIHQGG